MLMCVSDYTLDEVSSNLWVASVRSVPLGRDIAFGIM